MELSIAFCAFLIIAQGKAGGEETDMNIYEKMGDTIIVYMPREVDDYVAGWMLEGTEGAFADEVIRHAIFDFTNTTFMDSSGIGLITMRFRQLHDRGGSIGIIGANRRMDKILLMSGIYRIAARLDNGNE